MRRFLVPAAFLLALAPTTPAAPRGHAVLGPWLRAAAEGRPVPRFTPLPNGRVALAPAAVEEGASGPAAALPVFLLGDPDAATLAAMGVATGTRAGGVITARVPRGALGGLDGVPGLTGAVLARPVRLDLDVSVPSVRGDLVRSRSGDRWSGLTGKGVLVGIVDTGVDPTHGDFRLPDGTTRLVAYWDQGDPIGPPPGAATGDTLFGYGTEWSADQLNGPGPLPMDREGHGTHVAGIAVGNGRGSAVDSLRYRYPGIAPEADVAAVSTVLSAESVVLDAVSYVFSVAADRDEPAVVNLSLGTQFGPHDGTSPLDRGIDALLGPGRLVVAAAGNEGEDRIHAALELKPGSRDSVSIYVPQYSAPPCGAYLIVDGFHRLGDAVDLTVVTPSGRRFGPYDGSASLGVATGDGSLTLARGEYPGGGNDAEILLLLSDLDPETGACAGDPPPASGTWTLVLADRNGAPAGGEIDFWIALSGIVDFAGNGPYWDRGYEPGMEVSSPGTARRVITVGSYNTKACWSDSTGGRHCTTITPPELATPGRITYFSSRGPTRDGRQKPDLVAPGFVIASSRSHAIDPAIAPVYRFDLTLDPDREHFVFAGTSAAAPHVSGALALLLSRIPALTPEDAAARIRARSRRDADTGRVWNPAAGHGKLDVAALVDTTAAAPEPPIAVLGVGPNPFRAGATVRFRVATGNSPVVVSGAVFDVAGRRVRTLRGTVMAGSEGTLVWDGRDDGGRRVAPGLYAIRVGVPGGSGSVKVIRIP